MNDIELISEPEAKRLTQRIELLTKSISDQYEKWLEAVETAYVRQAWRVLGYTSWSDYAGAHLVVQVGRPERQQLVAALDEVGMSTRGIAAVLGVSNKTVSLDKAEVLPEGNSDPVVGTDGRTYSAPQIEVRPRRRSSLPDAFDRAVWGVRKAIDELERITTDDRFSKHQQDFRDSYAGQLLDLATRIQDVELHDLFDAPRRGDRD